MNYPLPRLTHLRSRILTGHPIKATDEEILKDLGIYPLDGKLSGKAPEIRRALSRIIINRVK